jgi:hypothetical protein
VGLLRKVGDVTFLSTIRSAGMARSLAPRRPACRTVKAQVTDSRSGRTVTGTMVINGKRVTVQRRAAFAISSGYQPDKKR